MSFRSQSSNVRTLNVRDEMVVHNLTITGSVTGAPAAESNAASEGAWSGVLAPVTNTHPTFTTFNSGRWMRVADVVFVSFEFYWRRSGGASSGDAEIDIELPFDCGGAGTVAVVVNCEDRSQTITGDAVSASSVRFLWPDDAAWAETMHVYIQYERVV